MREPRQGLGLRYPAFVAEIGREENRAKILSGIYTGYATVALLAVVSAGAIHMRVIPPYVGIWALIVAKLATNTASWIALRTRVLHLELAALNIFCDVVVLTGAIYYTGGPLSPLLPLYFIETTVMALLTNLGLTLVTVIGSFVCYAVMSVLVAADVCPLLPTPFAYAGALTPPYILIMLAMTSLVLLVPGIYVSLMIQRMRKNEAALEERARELVEAAKTKSQFMANVTHELRTPIHGILGLSDLLGEGIYGPVSAPQKEAVRGIQESGRNLLEMIDALLTLARAEAARLEVTVAPVQVDELVQSVAATVVWLKGKKTLEVVVDVTEGLPTIRSDRGKLVQVLVNLLANAVKFTPDGGKITLTALPWSAGGVELCVADTGIGIAPEELPSIFEEFHQVDGSSSRTYGGMGLGLAIVKKLCDRLHAEVVVASMPERGSLFRVRVPAQLDGPSGDEPYGATEPRAA